VVNEVEPKQLVKLYKPMFDDLRDHDNAIKADKTPPDQVKKQQNFEYITFQHMKNKMDEYYPGWQEEIISLKMESGWAIVHVRVTVVMPNGVAVSRDAMDAHRIQKNREKQTLVDPGNDIKAAVSDALKKAFSLFSIGADVYKFYEPVMTNEEVEILLQKAEIIGKRDIFEGHLEDGNLTAKNYAQNLARIERAIEEQEENAEG
jgi:hypothetical protein